MIVTFFLDDITIIIIIRNSREVSVLNSSESVSNIDICRLS
jgi:hypothetical protein